MDRCIFHRHLRSSASPVMLGTIAIFSFASPANATSVCAIDPTTSPQTFSCTDDAVNPAATATGTYTSDALFESGPDRRVQITSDGALDVVLNGQVNSPNGSAQNLTSAVYLTAFGPLTYLNNGAATGSSTGWMYNTYLRSDQSVIASSGTIVAEGYRVTGVFSETLAGDNTLTGGNTTVSGAWSRGLWTDAFDGRNVTNTGVVAASGNFSRAVIARALPNDDCNEHTDNLSTTVNVTGNVTADFVGVLTLTCGTSTVNVQSGTVVRVSDPRGVAISTIGSSSTVTNIDGSVLAASTAALAIRASEGNSLTTIGNTGLLSGTFEGDYNADSITITSGGEWTTAGTSNFGPGNDQVINGGILEARAVTFTNLERFANEGVVAISGGSFTLTGSAYFTNDGTFLISAGETTLTSDSAFQNNGSIDMQNGRAGDVFTITNNYIAGANAALYIDVSEDAADTFVVSGSTTGTTQLFVNAPQSINTNPILVGSIQPPSAMRSLSGGTVASPMRFSVGNQITRLIDLKLEQIGGNLYLAAVPNALAFQPLIVGQVVRDTWYQSASAHSANVGLRRGRSASSEGRQVVLWGQIYADRNSYGDNRTQRVFGEAVETDNRVRANRTGAQVGFDTNIGASMVTGITAGYQEAKVDSRGFEGGVKSDGYNVGAFAQFGELDGAYASVLVKYDWNDAKLTNSAFRSRSNDPNFDSFGGELAAGYRLGFHATRFDLGASLAYVTTSIEGFSAEGINYKFGSIRSIRGSVDARAQFGNGKIVPFARARLLCEFDGDSELTLASGAEADKVRANGKRHWVELEAGLTGKVGDGPLISAWAELGDVQGFGARAGWRF